MNEPSKDPNTTEPESRISIDWRTWCHRLALQPLRHAISDSLTGLLGDVCPWTPTDKDRLLAWALYVELRTRITTQRLHYLDGDEATALNSLFQLFQRTRDMATTAGPDAAVMMGLASLMLNGYVRPLTARWHERKLAGKLNPEDLRREFRKELIELQGRLTVFRSLFFLIATGKATDGTDAEKAAFETSRRRGQTDCVWQADDEIPYDRLLGMTASRVSEELEQIIAAETAEILDRRRAVGSSIGSDRGPQRATNLTGLAISGGGIRSATFALGVVQSLAKQGILKQVDLVSTVSGGGYLGSFLSSYLNTDAADVGPDAERAPFKSHIAGDSAAIRSLRNHSKYIQPRGFFSWITTISQALYGIGSNLMILSLFVFLAVAVTDVWLREELQEARRVVYAPAVRASAAKASVETTPAINTGALLYDTDMPKGLQPGNVPGSAMDATSWLSRWTGLKRTLTGICQQMQIPWIIIFLWTCLGGLLISTTAVMLVLLPIAQRLHRSRHQGQLLRVTRYEKALIFCGLAAGGIIILNRAVPIHTGYLILMKWIGETTGLAGASTTGWSPTATFVTLGNVLGLLAARGPWLRSLVQRLPVLGRLTFLLLWAAGPVLVTYTYFELCRVYIANSALPQNHGSTFLPVTETFLLLSLGSFVYGLTVNINSFSLHRFYRNRLVETFLLKHGEHGPRWKDQQKLSELRTPGSRAPYHLINTTVNLPSSRIEELRGRDSDFFLLSKHFCGSPALGYRATKEFERQDPHLDLGTAMAISGAAAAPQAGVTTQRHLSFLMTLLNVRLGYWLLNPAHAGGLLRCLSGGPGPLYLAREAFNQMDEHCRYLNLSDGGHIENLGMMELLRRRCRFLIVIDGEHDPELQFPSLRMLQRYAMIDLGVSIEINVERMQWFRLNSDGTQAAAGNSAADASAVSAASAGTSGNVDRFSKAHFAVGRVQYPVAKSGSEDSRPEGWLVYIKLSVTGNESDYVQDYRRRFPEFPHQPTLTDQIFDEDQFEAYRCLGEHAADDLFRRDLMADFRELQTTNRAGVEPASDSGLGNPDEAAAPSISSWMNALAVAVYNGLPQETGAGDGQLIH